MGYREDSGVRTDKSRVRVPVRHGGTRRGIDQCKQIVSGHFGVAE